MAFLVRVNSKHVTDGGSATLNAAPYREGGPQNGTFNYILLNFIHQNTCTIWRSMTTVF